MHPPTSVASWEFSGTRALPGKLARFASVMLFGLGLYAPAARAQPTRSLYLGLGMALQAVRDDTLVPLAFSGPRAALAPRFLGQVGPGLLMAEARLGLGYALDREHAKP